MTRLLVAIALLGSIIMNAAEAQPATPAPAPHVDYAQLLQELKPRLVIEFTEANLNAYLTNHPDLYDLPDGFEAAHVGFADGLIEISALTRLLIVPTRVRVSMIPEVVRGRLHLKVYRIHAGPLRLPGSFHRGAADTVSGVVNDFLDHNSVDLISVCAAPGLVRITAQAGQVASCAPAQ